MNIAIVGSRDFVDPKSLILNIVRTYDSEDHCILSGHAPGADTLGEDAAIAFQIPYRIWPARWTEFGKPAGPRRNSYIAKKAHVMYAFYTDITNSRGTKDVTDKAKKRGIPVHEFDQRTGVWTSSNAKNEAPSV